VDGGEAPASAPGQGVAGLGGLHDLPVCYDDDVLAAELLLELPHEPILDLLEALPQAEGHVDDDGLPPSARVNLLGGHDVKIPQVALELRARGLQVEQSLGHALLEAVGRNALFLEYLLSRGEAHLARRL